MSPAQPLPDARPPEVTPRQAALMAEVAHELRTPLNAVLGFADMLRARLHGPLDDRYGQYAELIHQAGRHLLSLVDDLQDLALSEAGRRPLDLKPIDARDPVRLALRLMQAPFAAQGVALNEAVGADPLPIRGDARALTQIALNLLANALKFTPRGGAATLALARIDGAVQLTVTDTGVGFAASPPPNAGGMGLGLALVRAMADGHGGRLSIAGEGGSGAEVVVRLPSAEG